MGWIGLDGMIIIGHRSSRSTFGAQKTHTSAKNGSYLMNGVFNFTSKCSLKLKDYGDTGAVSLKEDASNATLTCFSANCS